MIEFSGTCPICDSQDGFESADDWLRDHLFCRGCGSIPRERALAWALEQMCPSWREIAVHECSPADRPISNWIAREAEHYTPSQFFPDVPRGESRDGVRSEDLEALSFGDETLDLHLHLDVMEHVNRPDRCLIEMARTLRPGRMAIFTTPVYQDKSATQRRAILFPEGAEHIHAPEYHGNPISDDGALVTFHFGADIVDLMRAWEPRFAVTRLIIDDPSIGVTGAFRDVFVLRKMG